jgi:hypothetical protein
MSKPIEIIKTKSLSEDFNLASPDTQKNVLMYTNGVKPTSFYTMTPRLRFDSVDLSPITKAVLLFHGIKKK